MELCQQARYEAGYFDCIVCRDEGGKERLLPVRVWYPAIKAGTQPMPIFGDDETAFCLAGHQGVPEMAGLRGKCSEGCTLNAPAAEGLSLIHISPLSFPTISFRWPSAKRARTPDWRQS